MQNLRDQGIADTALASPKQDRRKGPIERRYVAEEYSELHANDRAGEAELGIGHAIQELGRGPPGHGASIRTRRISVKGDKHGRCRESAQMSVTAWMPTNA